MSVYLMSLLLVATQLGHCEPDCSFVDLLTDLNLTSPPSVNVRPTKTWNTSTKVFVDLTLYTIVNLDMNRQAVVSFIWFSMSWKNEFIYWDPMEYCNITHMFLPAEYFWKPDLYIYEMIESDDKSPAIPYVKLAYDGKVTNMKPLRVTSSCNIDSYRFPFDIQTCSLSFGSYVFTDSEINMVYRSKSFDVLNQSMTFFVSKGDWSLINITVENEVLPIQDETFSKVKYKISIQRSPLIYVINLIIPACLLVFLDVASMFMGVDTDGKLEFKVTIVLGFSVLLLILNDMLPNSDKPPILGIFFCVCLGMMVLSIIGCIMTSYLKALGDTHSNVSPWIKTWILRHLARVLCFKRKFIKEVVEVGEDMPGTVKNRRETRLDLQEKSYQHADNIKLEVQLLKRMLEGIHRIHRQLAKNKDDSKSEWYFVAQVIDRLILVLYLIIIPFMFIFMVIAWAVQSS